MKFWEAMRSLTERNGKVRCCKWPASVFLMIWRNGYLVIERGDGPTPYMGNTRGAIAVLSGQSPTCLLAHEMMHCQGAIDLYEDTSYWDWMYWKAIGPTWTDFVWDINVNKYCK